MAIDSKLSALGTAAAGSGPNPAALGPAPVRAGEAGAESEAAGAADACFAALFAWLMQVAPPAGSPGAAAGAADEPPGARLPSGQAAPRAPIHPLALSGAAIAAEALTVGGELQPGDARPFGFEVPAAMSAESAETFLASLASRSGEAAARPAGPIDLSFLSSPASAQAESARELPTAYAPSASPRAQLGAELGQRVVLMVEQGVHDARLKVHPEHLGPIEIRVRLEGDSAQVTFHSAHAAVRDALADAVPRLREMLGGAGLDLAHVDIGAGDPSHAGTPDDRLPSEARGTPLDAADEADVDSVERAPAAMIRRGLVDTFA